jgi:hypothetical protein
MPALLMLILVAQDRATITIYYPFFPGSFDTTEIVVDGKPVAKVHRGRKFDIRLPPGHHLLSASKFRVIPEVKPSDFVFQPGNHYFVALDMQQTSAWRYGRFFVMDVDPRVGVQRTEHLKFIDPKKVMNCGVVTVPACNP